MQWQRELSIADHKIASALVAQGDLAGALAADEDAVAAARGSMRPIPTLREPNTSLPKPSAAYPGCCSSATERSGS